MSARSVGPSHHRTTANRSHTLAGAVPVPDEPQEQAGQNQYVNCPYTLCLYTSPDGNECIEPINCGEVPEHFKKHGIKDLARGEVVPCKWQDCTWEITRHNYVRHIREHHLGHIRGIGH